jgi:septum formation inhibitor-activating ATPase MinD
MSASERVVQPVSGWLTPGAVERSVSRVAVGLGDVQREQGLLAALNDAGLLVGQRCLTAEQLLATSLDDEVLLLSADLHRLNQETLNVLTAHGRPLVLLGSVPGFDVSGRSRVAALPVNAPPEQVCQAVLALLSGQPVTPAEEEPAVRVAHATPPVLPDAGTVLSGVTAVVSGYGSPGCTTVALNLATALGAAGPTMLVDADLVKPSVVAHIDGDPTRNLYLVARAEPRLQRDWERALDQESQAIHDRSPQATVLCGIPKAEMRRAVTPRFIEGLLPQLQQRAGSVIVDAGAAGSDERNAVQQLIMRSAGQVLLVLTGDLLGVWQAQRALLALEGQGVLDRERTALVINRYNRRQHSSRNEIEKALRLPLAAMVPDDVHHAQAAIQAQEPLVLRRRSRAGRALLSLAERLHGGDILLPPEPEAERRRPGLRWPAIRVPLPHGWHSNVSDPQPISERGDGDVSVLASS